MTVQQRDAVVPARPRDLQRELERAEQGLATSAALLELLGRLTTCERLDAATRLVVEQSREFLGADQAVVALRHGEGPCRLRAVSGEQRFDARSEWSQAIEAAADESLLRDALTVWPPRGEHERHALRAHERLGALTNAECIVSVPLRSGDANDEPAVGAWLVLGRSALSAPAAAPLLLGTAESLVAAELARLQRDERRPLLRGLRAVGDLATQWRSRVLALLLVAALGLLAVPWPYTVRCEAVLQPVVRRFVAAPYDATLERTLVDPGDVVRAGDVLARIDARELRWELESLAAEQERAGKRRDSAMASHNVAESQVARLEADRLEAKMAVLRDRLAHVEIKSPLDGIVVTGDLEKAQGAPVTKGQVLFEIAPLDEMTVEVAVPESEVAYAAKGQSVSVVVDAYPRRTWTGTLARVHPRSEVRDDETVFVGDVLLKNDEGLLFPGMNGRAGVRGPVRPIGWIVFHRAWEAVAKTLGW